jgi:outer membrane biosynthesis protein TonB
VLAAIAVQTAAYLTYDLTRPTPKPGLTIRLDGEGKGQILVTRVGDRAPLARCVTAPDEPLRGFAQLRQRYEAALAPDDGVPRIVGSSCRVEVPSGTQVRLTAVLDAKATFGGYAQVPMRTPKPLVPFLGDPLAACLDADVMSAAQHDVFDCTATITADTTVGVELGLVPDEVTVALDEPLPSIDELVKPIAPPNKPAPIEPEKLDEPMDVAIVPPPKTPPPPIPQLQPPPPPPPPEPPQPKPQPPPPNMTMVEVKDDKNVKDKAPDDATMLSDKNRDVAEETRADKTNLEKESEGKEVASVEIGGPDDKIRQLEETEATTDKRLESTDHSGKDETAKGVIVGEGGDNGEEGTGENAPGILSMRDIGGRGAIQDQGKDGKKAGRKGTIGVNTPLAFEDYERIMGKDAADNEREVAARKMSAKKGRWERKLAAVKSSLENFVPDVRVGNQTALKTRAHPFALYVARMHRRIHELWGFGFLESLDEKSADYPLNNPDLWTNLEVSVNADGTVHKVTIVKTSGKTEFDVAAVDTILSSAPYDEPPEAIRSVDGRVYLRWGFYRNWRQCGTFNVEPYILDSVPDDGGQGLDDGAMVRNVAKLPGKKKPLGDKPVTPDDGKENERVSPKSTVTDKEAVFAANMWVSGFATASVEKLVKYSTVPFYAGGKVAASSTTELHDMYGGLIVESGPMKDWKLLSPREYTTSGQALPDGNVVLQVRTTKEAFAVVLTRTKSGEYRATQLAR